MRASVDEIMKNRVEKQKLAEESEMAKLKKSLEGVSQANSDLKMKNLNLLIETSDLKSKSEHTISTSEHQKIVSKLHAEIENLTKSKESRFESLKTIFSFPKRDVEPGNSVQKSVSKLDLFKRCFEIFSAYAIADRLAKTLKKGIFLSPLVVIGAIFRKLTMKK